LVVYMLKNKTIPTLGIISLFLIISISPVNANLMDDIEDILQSILSSRNSTLEYAFSDEDVITDLGSILFSDEDRNYTLENLDLLMVALEHATSYDDALNIFQNFLGISSKDNSVFQELFNGFYEMMPYAKRSIIVSHGHSLTLNPLRNSQINLLRPSMMFWHYSGVSQHMLKDKTIIVDPYPFKVKVIDGRQIGFMRRFIGVYTYLPGDTFEDSSSFFVGYVYKAIGIDLSPSN